MVNHPQPTQKGKPHMKSIQQKVLATLFPLFALSSFSFAQTTEVTANLLSKITRPAGEFNPADTFNVSFGSLNDGLFSLTTKTSADGAAGFASWYAANSRTLLNWNSVVGADITDADQFYRMATVNSIWSSTQNNQALALVTHTTGSTIDSIALFDLNFQWGNPADTGSYPFGVYDFISLSADQVTAVYGTADASQGTYGTLTTSSVPEPSSSCLFVVGALTLTAVRQIKRKI
jgi:hypothetical protein